MTDDKSIQGMKERNAGFRSGYAGEPRPAKDKGAAFYGGWLCGKAEREELKGEGK